MHGKKKKVKGKNFFGSDPLKKIRSGYKAMTKKRC